MTMTSTAQVARLSQDLAAAQLRLEIANVVVPLFHDMLEDADDRLPIIDDMVRAWQSLSAPVREYYLLRAKPWCPAAATFAEEYADVVERMLAEVDPASAMLSDEEHDVALRLHWRRHLAEVRARRAVGQAPPPEWLARFPVPPDPDVAQVSPRPPRPAGR